MSECERWYAHPSEVLPFELPMLIERLRTHGEQNSQGILRMVAAIMDARLARSAEFLECSKIEAKTENVGGVKVVLAKTDNRQAAGYFRGRHGDVVVIHKESGNANIFVTDEMKAVVLPAICRALIVAESKARGESDLVAQRLAALEAAGDEAMKGFALLGNGDETWYVSYGAVHNGSTTHPYVPATRLSAKELLRIVKEAIASVRS